MDAPAVLIARLVVLLDLLWDSSKDQIGLWTLISEVVGDIMVFSKRLASSDPKTYNDVLTCGPGV